MNRSIVDYYGDQKKDCSSLKKVFPNLDLKMIEAIYAKANEVNPINILAEKTCRRQKIATKPLINHIYVGDGFGKVDDALDLGYPLGLSVEMKIFGDHYGGGHAVSIVGRKYDCATNTYKYVVRNSWGKGACQRDLEQQGQSANFSCDGDEYLFDRKIIDKYWNVAYYLF